jgi:hypothetical protein
MINFKLFVLIFCKKFYEAAFYDAYVGIDCIELQGFYDAVQIYEASNLALSLFF